MKNLVLLLLLILLSYGGYYYYQHMSLGGGALSDVFDRPKDAGLETIHKAAETGTTVQTSAPRADAPKTYTSTENGVTFWYSPLYFLEEKNTGTTRNPERTIALIEDTKENRELFSSSQSAGRDGPTDIIIRIADNPKKLTASEWARQDSNFDDTQKPVKTSVGGEDAVSFFWDGLYASKTTVVVSGGRVYSFTVSWGKSTDRIITDYNALISSVVFGE
jgi:hypothetical protein